MYSKYNAISYIVSVEQSTALLKVESEGWEERPPPPAPSQPPTQLTATPIPQVTSTPPKKRRSHLVVSDCLDSQPGGGKPCACPPRRPHRHGPQLGEIHQRYRQGNHPCPRSLPDARTTRNNTRTRNQRDAWKEQNARCHKFYHGLT